MKIGNLIILVKKYDKYRTRNWFYYLGFIILGKTISSASSAVSLWTLASAAVVLAFIFSLNDFADGHNDKVIFIFPLVLMLFLLYFIRPFQRVALLSVLVFQIIYSLKPIRLKRIPILGTLCCTLAFPQFFILGYLEEAKFDSRCLGIFTLLIILSCLLQIIHEVNHIDQDNTGGIKTSAVFFGKKTMEHFCIALLISILALTYFLYSQDWLNLITLLTLFIFYLFITVDIFIFGIQYHSWRNLRILALLSGIVWFFTEIT
ncbi:MAG: UbiA prenyltransferase family protein [Candidatus Omnitrophica bacterium]|nr:UbiA prenyltransferase family protein [Candidatus Omnitrophota bacterium]